MPMPCMPRSGDHRHDWILLAYLRRKPLFVRYCGNWFVQTTAAELFWKLFMERSAAGRNVMLATGGAPEPPSSRNPAAQWIFSTTLSANELKQLRTDRTADPSRRARLIIVCRQEGGKGTELLLDSLPLVAEKFADVQLDIVGDGDALPALQARARELALQPLIFPVPSITAVWPLRDADLFWYRPQRRLPNGGVAALEAGYGRDQRCRCCAPLDLRRLLDAVNPRAVADAFRGVERARRVLAIVTTGDRGERAMRSNSGATRRTVCERPGNLQSRA